TDAQFHESVGSIWPPQASTAQVQNLAALCPNDVTKGSPFDVGRSIVLNPRFKRISAVQQGDYVFQAPRRFCQHSHSGKQRQWGFRNERTPQGLPFLGSFHASDKLDIYYDSEFTDYLINFATDFDPNGRNVPNWPEYTTATPKMMMFLDGRAGVIVYLTTSHSSLVSDVVWCE
ncbi:hypothetical protein DFH09DRAFT_925827, partial [Mycena vulgaris]